MSAAQVPELPDFIAAQLPYERRVWTLERGVDAGRRLHYLDHGAADARPVLMLHGNPTGGCGRLAFGTER